MLRYLCSVIAGLVLLSSVTGLTAQTPNDVELAQKGLEQLRAGIAALRLGIQGPEPKEPEWHPLDPKVQEWTDQVLLYCEKRSRKIKTLQCTYKKWDYDPSQTLAEFERLKKLDQLHLLPPCRYSRGVIKYAAPDKGLIRSTEVSTLIAQANESKWQEESAIGEQWITDGKRIFAFDSAHKEVVESTLPAECQGNLNRLIALPLLPGATAADMKASYWIRPLENENAGEYVLEFIPKKRQGWFGFQSVQIVIDEKEYLPIRLQVFDRGWSPTHPQRTVYAFENRQVNAKIDLREFLEVQIPAQWKHVKR